MPTDPSILTGLLNVFLDQFALGFGRLLPSATWLLQRLALIEIILAALWWSFKRDDALANFIQRILWVGFFIYLVTEFPRLVGVVVDSFVFAGLAAGGNSIRFSEFVDPSRVAAFGLTATMPIFDHIQNYGMISGMRNFGDIIITGISGLIILLAFFLIAIQIFVTYLEFYIAAVVGFLLIPFGVNRHTAFISERVFAMVISFGVKLMVLAFIASSAMPVLFSLQIPPDPNLNQIFSMLLASLAIAFLSWHAPAVAAGIMAGSPTLSAGTAAGSALAGGLAAAGAYRLGSQTLGQGLRYSSAIGKASVSTGSAIHTAARLGMARPVHQLGNGAVGQIAAGLRGVGQLTQGAASHALRNNRIAQGFKSAVAQGRVAGAQLSGLAPDGRVDGQNGTSPAGTA